MRKLSFLGDVWLPHPVRSNVAVQGELIFNLESPITKSTRAMPGKINLKAEDNHILETFGRAPVAVCLANNHIMDYCDEGFRDTVTRLERKGIRYFGAGRLEDNCNNPLMLEIGAVSVALVGYAAEYTGAVLARHSQFGAMPAELDSMLNDIDAARSAGAERIIVSLHWGAEQVYLPNPEDVRTAHALIDAGADLVVGHHAHCIQPYEIYKGKYVFYGLGNCVFPDVPARTCVDEAGAPVRRRPIRPQRWNRFSLAVDYRPETGSVDVSVLKFDGTTLNMTDRDAKRHLMDFSSLSSYEKRFKRSYAYGRLRNAVARYLSYPRMPRLRHLRTLISLICRREYSVYK